MYAVTCSVILAIQLPQEFGTDLSNAQDIAYVLIVLLEFCLCALFVYSAVMVFMHFLHFRLRF